MKLQASPGNPVVEPVRDEDVFEGAERPVHRIAAIHDLSCFGRCALTVVIPTLSAMGNQVVPVPTALLSTHTGGFSGMYFCDLTDSMTPVFEHFGRLGLKFDAVYTGFLGSDRQLDVVGRFLDRFADSGTTVMVDPVMGDDGILYSTYTEELMRGMAGLCRRADIITPNLTEACFLTGIPYEDTAAMEPEERTLYTGRLIGELYSLTGAGRIVITGICDGPDRLLTVGAEQGKATVYVKVTRVPKNYPGTGDFYASVLLGALLRGDGFAGSVGYACRMTRRVMAYSAKFDTPTRDGVALERFLGELAGSGEDPEREKN